MVSLSLTTSTRRLNLLRLKASLKTKREQISVPQNEPQPHRPAGKLFHAGALFPTNHTLHLIAEHFVAIVQTVTSKCCPVCPLDLDLNSASG